MTFTMTRGTVPAIPSATDVALEASVTQDRAAAMIAASWHQAETWTGRLYWPVTAATLIAELGDDATSLRWPRRPAPDVVTVEVRTGGDWIAATGYDYIPETGTLTGLTAGATVRVAQDGTLTPAAPAAHVVEGVRALALYQLIHSAARREFRTIGAGDSSLTREALDGLLKASGAGILLAGECTW